MEKLFSYDYKEFEVDEIKKIKVHLDIILPLTRFLREDYDYHILKSKLYESSKKKEQKTYLAYVYNKQKIIGFSLFDICEFSKNIKVMYMRLVVVNPTIQSKGAYSFLLKKRILIHKPNVLVGRFHNPRIYETISKISKSIYPDILGFNSKEIFNVAQKITKKYVANKNYDSLRSVAREIYLNTSDTFLAAKEEAVNNYYTNNVGANDSLVVIAFL